VQLVQTVEASAAEYLPAPQSPQVEKTLAPTVSENLPALQLVQAEDPLFERDTPALLFHFIPHASFHVPTIVNASAALLST
jgi:hypothetical protein